MKVKLLMVGKTSEDFLKTGIEMYSNRIKHYIKFEIVIIKDIKTGKNMPSKTIKTKEEEQILKHVTKDDLLILLDEKGKLLNSIGFSKHIENKINSGIKSIIFLIGGAYGFSENIYKRANEKVSLSKMTFSHQLIRIIFCEQLYRAFTIIKGEPYHNE